ncbi:hypothetical protein P154DRAFT_527608 [Amniculicola lignicola CBS 123094]|uniref:Cryptic loci regulator 2 N-terminal domain-containing protein n=1 Tax=Amniculicola lignicola CBS 123094 TaxID=1392246 RepID=A0A6A5VVW3_9PLEO|nr:hypothetical protein P154DRAFT_527608 [Amniculicola lignicola CBS 123094]
MASPMTTEFWPIFPHKSDGVEEVKAKGKPLRNAPTAQQLDQTPNAQGICDYYRLVGVDEPKHLDWRKKLGGMLLREIGGKAYESRWCQSLLLELPEGYRLYEHIKSKADGSTKTVKNHSGGGHDRQDAYLYGYPQGPKKRFRSPVEFFPHLLWLATDVTSDYENCTCRLCSPYQLDLEKPVAKQEADPPKIKQENAPTPTPTPGAVVGRNPIVQIPARRPSGGTPVTQSPALKPATPKPTAPVAAPVPPQVPVVVSSPLPQPRSMDQQVDCMYNRFVCRTGEVVWFFREKLQAWGLGLIIRRWQPHGAGTRAYVIQPLCHPQAHPSTEIVSDETKLKPWLAWSVPAFTNAYLAQHSTLTYDQIDWPAMCGGNYGEGNAEVDASILAAKGGDSTYTPFERLKTTNNMAYEERHWNGIYFGNEKIWTGDPVRIRIGPQATANNGSDVMVITNIVERTHPAQPQQVGPPTTSVYVVGDIYSYSTLTVTDPSRPPAPPQDSNIPIRMREDLAWRNKTLIPKTRTMGCWKLIRGQTRLDLPDINGRWYETSLIFQDFFQISIDKKEGGLGVWMNARGDASGIGKAIGLRKATRIEAFGRAIEKNTQLTEGLEVPADIGQNTSPANDLQALEIGTGDPSFALDEFMNLDGMDGGNLGFGDDFNFS